MGAVLVRGDRNRSRRPSILTDLSIKHLKQGATEPRGQAVKTPRTVDPNAPARVVGGISYTYPSNASSSTDASTQPTPKGCCFAGPSSPPSTAAASPLPPLAPASTP